MHARPRPRHDLTPVVFRPPRALGVIVGGGLVAWAVVGAGLAIQVAVGAPAEFKTLLAWAVAVVLAGLAVAFANWTYGLFSMAYVIDADNLTVECGFRRVVIPIASIQRMIPGRTLDEAHVEGLNWWGCHIGTADVKRVGYTMFYSTHSAPEELLYLVTSEAAYALTVLDQAAFAEEIQGRAVVGAVQRVPQRSIATGLAAFPFWRDRVAIAMAGLSALACLALGGYLLLQYPGLPRVVQLNFPALGGVVRIGEKDELLRIIYLGVAVLAANSVLGVLVHARERAAGLWLFASGGMLQAVLLAAAVTAVERS